MILLIDGYNLLKNMYRTARASPSQIQQFKSQLVRYSKKSKNKLIIVFDGGPDIYPTRETVDGVVMVYSGTKRSADEVIQEYIQQLQGKDVVLISTDRALDAYAHRSGINHIDSADFDRLMQERMQSAHELKRPGSDVPVKTTTTANPELDLAMVQASDDVMIKKEGGRSKQRQPQQLSKKEKRLHKQVKKI